MKLKFLILFIVLFVPAIISIVDEALIIQFATGSAERHLMVRSLHVLTGLPAVGGLVLLLAFFGSKIKIKNIHPIDQLMIISILYNTWHLFYGLVRLNDFTFTLGDTYRAAVMPSAYFIYRALITDIALLLRLINWIVSLQLIVMFTSIVYQTLYFMNTGVFLLGGTSISMFLFAYLLARITWGVKRGNSFGLKLLFATVFVGVVLSFKRALWMSVGVIMVWYSFWNARYLRVTKRLAGVLLTIILLFGFGLGASPILFGEVSRRVLDRVGGTFGGGRISIDQLDSSGTHRLAEFTDSWRYMLSAQYPARIMNLIFGMGNGGEFSSSRERVISGTKPGYQHHIHSGFMLMLFRYGFVGVSIMAMIFFCLWLTYRENLKSLVRGSELYIVNVAILVYVMFVSIVQFTGQSYYGNMEFGAIAGMMVGLNRLTQKEG